MLPLILVLYSLADAETRTVNIPCGEDIDATINADPRDTASRFVLGADCTFAASATIVPSDGDEVACAVAPTFVQRGQAFDPTTRCTVAGAPSVAKVFWPIGKGGAKATVHFEGITITGGDFTGSSATGTGIAEGVMSNSSSHYGIEVRDNDAAGITNAKGTFERVELTNNTLDPNALGFIGAGMKALTEVEVKNSYIHETQGNGLWCDQSCVDSTNHPNGFWVHDNLVVNNGRAGIRFENVGEVAEAGEALIENNEVHGNSLELSRGGIDIRDAQNVLVRNNVFGATTIADVAYLPNSEGVAIRATDSGRLDRPDLWNVDIIDNVLNGELITGCELADEIVYCSEAAAPPPPTDTTPPETTPSAKTADGNIYNSGAWTNKDVTLTLTASDGGGSGVDKIFYNTEGSTNYQEYSAPLSVTSEGTTTISYYASDKAGNQGEAKTFTVKIDKMAPKVTSTVPGANVKGVDPTINVKATFSEDMLVSEDPLVSSITGKTFKLFKQGSTTKLAATVSYDEATDTATLNPTNNLSRGATYKAVVTTGAKDLASNPLAQQYGWFFTIRS
jgi:hypothetical protein